MTERSMPEAFADVAAVSHRQSITDPKRTRENTSSEIRKERHKNECRSSDSATRVVHVSPTCAKMQQKSAKERVPKIQERISAHGVAVDPIQPMRNRNNKKNKRSFFSLTFKSRSTGGLVKSRRKCPQSRSGARTPAKSMGRLLELTASRTATFAGKTRPASAVSADERWRRAASSVSSQWTTKRRALAPRKSLMSSV